MHELSASSIEVRTIRPIKVMQFGGGNFLRAFIDWMIDELNTKTDFNGNVAIIKPTPKGDYTSLRNQDGLFHVVLNGIKNGKLINDTRLIDCVSKVIHPYNEWDSYLSLAEVPELRFIISNTTESGIRYNADDIPPHGECPKEYPAKLTLWLHRRFRYFNGDASKACIILPLELIEDNGSELRDCIIQYAGLYNLEMAFTDWLSSCVFCNTLVDRIVSGYSQEVADNIAMEKGLKDQLVVSGEYYHSWIIQASVDISDELPVTKTDLNVKFADNLRVHREIKVKILNGAHTSMVPVGYLMGIETVVDAMNNVALRNYIERELRDEILPTIDYSQVELGDYCLDVLDRFSNPTLQHKLLDIALNSTSKYVTRLLPSLLGYHDKTGELPKRIVFALAALIRMYKGEWKGVTTPLRDDESIIYFFNDAWGQHADDLEQLTHVILKNQDIWGQDLTLIDGLVILTSSYLSDIKMSLDKTVLRSLD